MTLAQSGAFLPGGCGFAPPPMKEYVDRLSFVISGIGNGYMHDPIGTICFKDSRSIIFSAE